MTQQHIQSATNIRVSRNEMVPVFDALCTGMALLVFVGAFVAEKLDSVHTYWFVQMVVLFRVQVVPHFPQRGLNLKSCVLPISLQEPLKHS